MRAALDECSIFKPTRTQTRTEHSTAHISRCRADTIANWLVLRFTHAKMPDCAMTTLTSTSAPGRRPVRTCDDFHNNANPERKREGEYKNQPTVT